MARTDYSQEFNHGRFASRLMSLYEGVAYCVSNADDCGVTNYELDRLRQAKELISEAEQSYYIRHRVETKEERQERQRRRVLNEM